MHSMLERAEPPTDPDSPGRPPTAAPRVVGAPGNVAPPPARPAAPRDLDALRAALRGLEEALAQRHSSVHDFWSAAGVNGRSGAPRPQAVPFEEAPTASAAAHPYRRRRLGGRRSPILGGVGRASAALVALLRVLLVGVARLQGIAARLTRPLLFSRETTAVVYPKRRPGAHGDRSLADYVIPSIPFLASVGVIALILTSYPGFVANLVNRTRFANTPSLVGRRLAEAEQAAQDAGLRIEVARVESSENTPKDMVIDQDPRMGMRLEPGALIRLVVSSGLRPPDVAGKTIDQARVDLIIHGWRPNPEVETRVANGAPNVVIDQRPGPRDAVAEKGTVTLVVAAPNLALGKATRTNTGAAGPEAVDGQPSSVAWPAAPGPSWVEIELGVPSTVAALTLLPATERSGPAVVEVWAWDVSGRFYPLQLLAQDVADGTPLTARLSQPAINAVRLRVATTSSAAPLGWREITVLDR